MANPFDSDDSQILEGFLCPLCREDLKTPEKLTIHVEKVHAEEQDVVKSLKDIFSIAKKKIKLNFDETVDLAKAFDTTLKSNYSGGQIDVITDGEQTVGVDCDHFSYLNAIRTPRLERYASETNKLIIRIDKLLKERPTDPVQRKLHDQKTVPWLDGSSVKLCPNCAKSFNFTRRQHHCRLCGTIMCKDCSLFLKYEFALQLANLAQTTEDISKASEEGKQKDEGIRVCDHCLRLLETRKEMQDSRTCRPPITLYYDRIKEIEKEIAPDIPMYSKIIKSLYDGDTIFTLADASALRGKIGHAAEKIDSLSKAILSLPCPQGSREEALKKAVRLACIKMIKEEMLSIPSLPDEQEIKKIRDRRRMETEQRIERERRLALEAHERYGLGATNSTTMSNAENAAFGSAMTTLDNWSAYQSSTATSSDPLVEQINIIKGYIKQARQDLRFEEVATLEMNLRELQGEFYRRHQETKQA